MTRSQWAVVAAIAATALGLAVTIALIASVGFDQVFGILARIGLGRFAVYCGWTLVILTVMGLGWQMLTPGASRLTYIWARTMREAATDVLPFSQFGGIVVALRVLIARGVAQPTAYASIIADQTAELVAQLVYTLFGLAALALVLSHAPGEARGGTPLLGLALTGFGASVAVIALFAFAQAPMLAFAGRIGGTLLPGSAAAMDDVRAKLAGMYQQRARLIACFLLHLTAWVASGAGAVIVLRTIGADVPLINVVIIESLIFTLRTAAFLIPGGIGVQEGAYVLIGPLFGLPAEAALALSLAKRARDLAVGVPAMLIWQLGEARGVMKG